MSTLGVLVAGGAGSRLALGMPKALVRLGGVTLLERGIATLATVCDEIVVSAPAALALPLSDTFRSTPVERRLHRADDPARTVGPLAGMVAGLSRVAFERAIVLGVDLPFMRRETLETLLGRLRGHQAVIPVAGGFPQPLAAAYAPVAGPILMARLAAGERSPTRALDSLDVLRLEEAELALLPGGLGSFFNLNSPADLEAAAARMAGEEAST